MSNIFMAGRDLVRWELTSLGVDGPFRLAMHHPHGAIVEYFRALPEALVREAELEHLMTTAYRAESNRTEVAV